MATGFTVTGRGDLDAIFKARTSAAIANVAFRNASGTDLSQLFEPRAGTTPVANTGFRAGPAHSNQDLALLFQSITAITNTISIADETPNSNTSAPPAVCRYILENDGDIMATFGVNAEIDFGDWISPKSNFGNYSVRATFLGGQVPGGSATGVWLNLATTREWNIVTGSSDTCSLLIEIRLDSSGVVQDSANIMLTADVSA